LLDHIGIGKCGDVVDVEGVGNGCQDAARDFKKFSWMKLASEVSMAL